MRKKQSGFILRQPKESARLQNCGNFILPWEENLILNPILKVLSTLKKYKVKSLLIGGQACIIYGAAEFSRDSDFVVLCEERNLQKLQMALEALKAGLIYVPPLEIKYLEKGHACHFRCSAKDVRGLRIDIISKLRGCESFDKLWERRRTISLKDTGGTVDVIGLGDLAQSKKTQRDKDWLMLRRLVENDIILYKDKHPSDEQIKWWLLECRTPGTLVKLVKNYSKIAKDCSLDRPLLISAIQQDLPKLNSQLKVEERIERQKDIEYWAPLRKELEVLRHKNLRKPKRVKS
ncbi:hypothetical protein HY945_00970 [Candidatus Gottesmanbacteria bacterium]|nr:hypothetical protein [Candidatus Gottesmanbacteria bacterium]